jgi:hypothetical protein
MIQNANFINHIAMVLDASSSMDRIKEATIQVADNQVRNLATHSQEVDQETRLTVYTFSNEVHCAFYDKDALRLPSVSETYCRQFGGMTSLIDATIQAIEDLEKSATLYGDHTFLLYILTDGYENASRRSAHDLRRKLTMLPDSWTLGILVPDIQGVHQAKTLGFASQNIQVWNPSEKGIQEVGRILQTSTVRYMDDRATGVYASVGGRSYGLFTPDVQNLTTRTVSTNLDPIVPRAVINVTEKEAIRDKVQTELGAYTVGSAYYQLTKPETVQAGKQVMVREKKTGKFFGGHEARQLLNIPSYEVRVAPASHPNYDIFVQSTSWNRNLVPNTQVVVT